MSVIVRNMKMPTGCLSCDFCNPFAEKPYCRRLMQTAPACARLKDCPLDELPEHVNLISARRIEFELCESTMPKTYREFCRRVLHDRNLTPIVVEAEE